MRKEYTFRGTTGIQLTWQGKTYQTVSDIRFEQEDSIFVTNDDWQGPVTLTAECTTDDPEAMWGAGDADNDWFPPEAHWTVERDDLQAWADAGDWQSNLDGVLTCDKPDD